jgi:hypothetical protein
MAAHSNETPSIGPYTTEVLNGVFGAQGPTTREDKWEEFGTARHAPIARAALVRAFEIEQSRGSEAAQAYLEGVVDGTLVDERERGLAESIQMFNPEGELAEITAKDNTQN